ncbi:hypothetical protein HPB48_026673 [Haemaphysalis longicornis]|uniref:Uncharacterized protein n=1 Tax=Haemaphysalis longicornis TaxID=44386 RepID=A0A9J6HA32_HAELO|nr:hypothetical protein HPB48_026673 [Haemaphysalis longicornis]
MDAYGALPGLQKILMTGIGHAPPSGNIGSVVVSLGQAPKLQGLCFRPKDRPCACDSGCRDHRHRKEAPSAPWCFGVLPIYAHLIATGTPWQVGNTYASHALTSVTK